MQIAPTTKLKKWEILSSKDISPSKWMPLRLDTVRVKDDKVIDFYLITRGHVVMVLPFTKDKKLVLIRQYKLGVNDIIIEGPAGMVEKDQEATAAAIRELEEETGIKYDQSKLIELGTHSQDLKLLIV